MGFCFFYEIYFTISVHETLCVHGNKEHNDDNHNRKPGRRLPQHCHNKKRELEDK